MELDFNRELIESGFKDFDIGKYLTDDDMRQRFAQYGGNKLTFQIDKVIIK